MVPRGDRPVDAVAQHDLRELRQLPRRGSGVGVDEGDELAAGAAEALKDDPALAELRELVQGDPRVALLLLPDDLRCAVRAPVEGDDEPYVAVVKRRAVGLERCGRYGVAR